MPVRERDYMRPPADRRTWLERQPLRTRLLLLVFWIAVIVMYAGGIEILAWILAVAMFAVLVAVVCRIVLWIWHHVFGGM